MIWRLLQSELPSADGLNSCINGDFAMKLAHIVNLSDHLSFALRGLGA